MSTIILYICIFVFYLSFVSGMEFMITLPINHEQSDFLKEKLLDISNPESENWRKFLKKGSNFDSFRVWPISTGRSNIPITKDAIS